MARRIAIVLDGSKYARLFLLGAAVIRIFGVSPWRRGRVEACGPFVPYVM
jgi:hypothetical protein